MRLEDAEIVTLIRNGFAAGEFARITSVLRRIDQGAKRALGLAFGNRPIKPVMLSSRANETGSIHAAATCLLGTLKIIALRIDGRQQCADRREFIAANATVYDRLRTSFGIERPTSVALDERDWHRPIIWTNVYFCVARAGSLDRVLLIIQRNESPLQFLIGIFVTRVDDPVRIWSEESLQVGLLVVAQGGNERLHRFLGRFEAALGLGDGFWSSLSGPEP